MTTTQSQGLEGAEASSLVATQAGQTEVLGFNGQTYSIAVEAGTLSVATVVREPRELELSYDQQVIAKFALEHSGEPFRGSDIPNLAGATLPRDKFNAAIFDRSTGLLPFFTKITGPNMLWYRDLNVHQLGDMSLESTGESAPRDVEVEHVPHEALSNLSIDQQVIIEATRGIIPPNGIQEAELLDELSGLLPDYMPEQMVSLLRSAIHKMQNTYDGESLAFAERGRGARQAKYITIGSGFSTRVQPEKSYSQPSPTAVTSKEEVPAMPTEASPQLLNRRKNRKKDLGTDAVKRTQKGSYDPEESRRQNLPVEWDISLSSFVVNGEAIEVHPRVLSLIDVIRMSGDKYAFMSELAMLYKGGRMAEPVFKRFVVWANLSIDAVNSIAPVVIVDNRGRDERRDRRTQYKFNEAGDWSTVTKMVQGTSLDPKDVE